MTRYHLIRSGRIVASVDTDGEPEPHFRPLPGDRIITDAQWRERFWLRRLR